MSRKTKTPDRRCDHDEQHPSRLELRCLAEDIVIEAAAGEGDGEVIPRFLMVAYTGGPMQVDGWRFPVVVDLEGLAIPSQRRPVRFAHSMFAGVGHTERIAVENGQLVAEGVVSRDTAAAREVVASGKRGFPWQASIGAQVAQSEFVRAGKGISVNGRTFEGPLYVARRTTLGEISFVDLGADTHTAATIAAQQQEDQVMEDEKDAEATAGAGASKEANAGAKSNAASHPADSTTAGSVDAVAELRAQAATETKRINAIRKTCGSRFPEIEEKAIAFAKKAPLEDLVGFSQQPERSGQPT